MQRASGSSRRHTPSRPPRRHTPSRPSRRPSRTPNSQMYAGHVQTGRALDALRKSIRAPGTPETPGTPRTPNSPASPGTPRTPGTPSTPGTPRTPGTPSTLSTPRTPGTPGTPGTRGSAKNQPTNKSAAPEPPQEMVETEDTYGIVASARTQLLPTAGVVCPIQYPHMCGAGKCAKSAAGCADETVFGFRSMPLMAPTEMPVFDDVLSEVKIIKVLTDMEKRSASISVIAFAEHVITKQRVVIKAFFKQKAIQELDPLQQARMYILQDSFMKLTYEAKMYKALSELGAVPNLVQFIAYQSMPMNKNQFRERRMAEIKSARGLFPFMLALKYLVKDAFEPVSLHMIVTEYRPQTVPLLAVFESNSMTPDRLRAIMFQIVYTLTVLNAAGFQHNDLHPGNILVDMAPAEIGIQYEVYGGKFSVPVAGNKVLLFDWDFGVCPSCGINSFLDRTCASLGICNHINPKFDLFTIMSMMEVNIKLTAYADYHKFRKDVLGSTPLVQKHPARMCNEVVRDGKSMCVPFDANEPHSVMHPRDALLHDYFSPFRQG